jgi:hypothetical protein
METNRPQQTDVSGMQPIPNGRPLHYDADTLLLVFELAQAKYTNNEIGAHLGYPDDPQGHADFSKTIGYTPALAKALRDAREVADAKVAGQLYRNAVQPQEKHPFGQLEAQKTWLKASANGRWNERSVVELEGLVGTVDGSANPALEERIAAILARKVKMYDL